MQLLNQLSWYFIREWRRYLSAIILLIVIAILQLIPPYIVGIIVDHLIHHINTDHTMVLIGIILIISIIIYFLRYVWRILLFGASYKLAIELRKKIYHKLSIQYPSFYFKYRTGDLMARATYDIDCVVLAAGEGVLTLIDSLVMGCIVLLLMSIKINWKLTFISLIPMPIMALIIHYYGNKLNKRFQESQIAFANLNNQTQEILTSIRMIKSFGIEEHKLQQFTNVASQATEKNLKVSYIDVCFDPTIYIAISCSNLLAVTVGSWFVWHNIISLGKLASFIMYLGLMIWPMLALAWMFNIVERGSAAWKRIHNLLVETNIALQDGNKILPIEQGSLQVNIHRFCYPSTTNIVLNNLKFQLKPGKILGLCGPTGAGKSTLLNIIQRNFNVEHGNITYNNIPLLQLRIDVWRSRLAVVNQISFLFSDTIANNISLGKPNASQEEIELVAKQACIHDDIIRLPLGYKTKVGERGIMLSGGQKQRIAIARALLVYNTEILILDDVLSAVDVQTEHKILQNILIWSKNKTLIISAHRLSALCKADEILVLHNGIINQRGNHTTLLSTPGWYRDMYRYQQLKSYLDE